MAITWLGCVFLKCINWNDYFDDNDCLISRLYGKKFSYDHTQA